MRNSTKRSLHLAAIAALGIAAACSPATTRESAAGVTPPPNPELSIDPPSARLSPGNQLTFQALGTAAVPPITWSVQEGSAAGSITAGGVYTAPSLNGTFHVQVAAGGKTATAPVIVSGQPPPATGAPMTTANRTGGVAPLAVFFDAVDTVPEGEAAPFAWSSGVYQPPDADYEAVSYVWDFGDASAGVWATTGISRNIATGYTTAHLYETPGTYTASLTVTARDGTVYTYKQTITVGAFSGTTYYVSAAGSDANDGLSEATPFLTANKGLSMASAANRRILFRRGDSFALSPVQLRADGPGIVGAYGTGAKPQLNTNGSNAIVVFGADWRVMDLAFPVPAAGAQTAVAFDSSVQAVNALFLRLDVIGSWQVGLGWSDWTPILTTPHDGATLMECEVGGSVIDGLYLGGRRLALLGNNVHDMATSHVVRVWQAHKGVIAHNRMWNPGPTRHALKLHGGAVGDHRPETRWVTISDNLVRGKTWSVAIGPQDGGKDERLNHIVFERNRFWAEGSVQVDLELWARSVLVRNNVFDATGASPYYTAIAVGQRGIEPASQNVKVLNNTMFRADAGQEFYMLWAQPVVNNLTYRNNLAYAPQTSPSRLVLFGSAGTGFVNDHNLFSTAGVYTNAAAGDLSLASGSAAVDAGATMPEVRTDFLGVARPVGAAPDLGAFESH